MGGCGWKWHTCLFFVISPCGVVGKGFGTKEILAKSTAVTGTGISRPIVCLGCICQNMRFCIKLEIFNFGGGNISLSVFLICFLLPSLSANNTLIIICSFRWLDIRQPLVCHISAMCRQIHKVGCFTPLGKRFVCSFVDKLCKVNNLFYISQIIWRFFLLHFCYIFQGVCLFADKNRDIFLSLMFWYITRCVMFRPSFQ